MNNFITNSSTRQLKKRILELLTQSEKLKFLVGFFYFSGLQELYQGLRQNPNVHANILVGLNVDITNHGLIEYADSNVHVSDEDIKYRFFESIKKSINSDCFDTREFYEQVSFFLTLIKDGRLVIRKTRQPNHSKLYIFHLGSSQIARNKLFITGSSNLTSSGLSKEQEFNVEISDYGVDDAERYFDDQWQNSIKITEDDITRNNLIHIVERETLIKKITPFEAYVLVLKNYLDTFAPGDLSEDSLVDIMKRSGYIPYRYQIDAVKQALDILEKNNGVIIADVVGLGKTIIACLAAKKLRKRGIVLCPPGIIGNRTEERSGWKWYLESFGLFDWEVESIGILDNEEAAKSINQLKDLEVIIIDEAHRFRNEDTKSYEQLKNICRNRQVILLTATPFNNRPGDILSLLKFFVTPKKSILTLENDIVDRFKEFKTTFDKLGYIKKYHNSSDEEKKSKAQSYYQALFGETEIDLTKVIKRSHYIARQIRDIIEPVTIRRNRIDLQKNPHYKDEVKNLTKVADPIELFFELNREQSNFYDRVIQEYFATPEDGGLFKGAIYRPFEYKISPDQSEKLSLEDNRRYQQQRNLYDFMRRLLVKRFESSFGSFRQSIENFKNVTDHCIKFIEKTGKFILDRNLLEKIYQMELDDIEKELTEYAEKITQGVYPKNHEIYKVNEFEYKEEFLEDIKSDLRLFEKILGELSRLDLADNDPKLACLMEKLKSWREKEPERRIVIFSEYIDTVKYLQKPLNNLFNNRVLVVGGDLSASKIKEINANFDASNPNQRNDYDILLCTDRISEGFNLNRAGLVINYDIPWNPVRVIQRLGRINRIGKKVFNEIYIANFFPTELGAELVKSREIATQKMFLIHKALGEDSKIFDIDEEPTASDLYQRIQQNPDNLEAESFYTKILNEYEKIKNDHPDIIERIKDCPPRVKVAKNFSENELIVFIKKAHFYVRRIKQNNSESEPENLLLDDVIPDIRCKYDEEAIELSENFWDAYEKIKVFKEKTTSLTEQSLERRALNNLKTLLLANFEIIKTVRDFIRTLIEDINGYGTLPDYTLRRIGSLELSGDDLKKAVEDISKLRQELGEDYLKKEKQKIQGLKKEIIIAIENRRMEKGGDDKASSD